ncbi:MAG: GNAT family N-acetyltransferase [Pseudonocardiales bacterium]
MATPPQHLTMRPIADAELPALTRLVEGVFLDDHHDDEAEIEAQIYEPERSLAVFDGDQPVASAVAYSRNLTVPGGPLPAACVSWVAVAPTHRRRGLLTRMMRHQLTELHDRSREAVAVLWASESAIYGRFGYGPASQACRITVSTRDARMLPQTGGAGRVRLLLPVDALPDLTAVYESVRPDRVGLLDRRGAWWQRRLFDPERWRDGASSLRVAVHEDASGRPDAFALYNTKATWDAGPQGEIGVRELLAATPAGYAGLWRFLLQMDLVRTVRWDRAAADEALPHLLGGTGAVQQSLSDALWVRIVDVDRALSARRYSTPTDLVLEISDDYCPWNSGRYRLAGDLQGADCTSTMDRADLSLPVAALGAAYLGGMSLSTLAAAGLVTERRPGALQAATAAFTGARAPYAPEVF